MRTKAEIEHVLNTAKASIIETRGADLEAMIIKRILSWVLEKNDGPVFRYPDPV